MYDSISKSNEWGILDDLKDIFENTNKWLIFAESKNGILLGLNGVILFKISDCLNGIEVTMLNTKMIWILFIVFLISTVIILKSFFPNYSTFMDKPINMCKEVYDGSNVLMFYEEISKYESSEMYLRDLYKYYFDKDVEPQNMKKYELDYAKEILINSRITSSKYKHFKWALRLDSLAIILLVIFYVVA